MPKSISLKQQKYIIDLLSHRDWADSINGDLLTLVERVLHNSNPDNASSIKFVSSIDASRVIRALLMCPTSTSAEQSQPKKPLFGTLQVILKDVKPGFFALPRRSDPNVWDFFEVVERPNGARWVNMLQGSPGDFKRLSMQLITQTAAARAIAGDVTAAAKAFAERSGSCPRCNSPLTKAKSLVAKIGPHCAKEWGWPY